MDSAMLARREAGLRLGGAMVTLGTIAWMLLNGLHGEMPGAGQQVVEAARGALWRPLHLFTIVAIVIVASGLALLSGTLSDARALAIGHAGAMIAVPAAAVLGVGFAIDGFVLAALADAYAAAPDEAARAMYVMQADFLLHVIGATSFAFQTLFGMAIVMLSIATYLSREYPHWHCWLGMVGGTVWTIAGVLIFLRVPDAAYWLIFLPVLPIAIWLLGYGWLAWQQTTKPAARMAPEVA